MLVVMDANEATIGLLRGKSITVLWNKESRVPGKMRPGGQSAARFQREREEKLKHWMKDIAEEMKRIVYNGSAL